MYWTQPLDETEGSDQSIAVTALPDEHDPSRILQGLLGGSTPDHPPLGRAIVSDVTRETVGTLESVASLLRDRRRDARPILVGVSANPRAVDEVSDAFELTLAVGSDHESYLPGVKRFVPTLCTEHQMFALGDRFSIRAGTVDVGGLHPGNRIDVERVAHELRADRGIPLHHWAEQRDPDAFVFAAPGSWHDTVRDALGDIGPVLAGQGSRGGQIAVAGLVFDSEAARRGAAATVPDDGEGDPDEQAVPDRAIGSTARFPDREAREEAIEELGEAATDNDDD
ncbi:hypothetical protein ACOJIV_18240 [Haloarcula sp. AONF1]